MLLMKIISDWSIILCTLNKLHVIEDVDGSELR